MPPEYADFLNAFNEFVYANKPPDNASSNTGNTNNRIAAPATHTEPLSVSSAPPGDDALPPSLRVLAERHTSHLIICHNLYPTLFLASIHALAHLHSHPPSNHNPDFPLSTSIHCALYASTVLYQLPIQAAPNSPTTAFPLLRSQWPHMPPVSITPVSSSGVPTGRLRANLERVWDEIMPIYRARFDAGALTHAFSRLHPANMEHFSQRLLDLAEKPMPKSHALNKRLHTPTSNNSASRHTGPITQHRIPPSIRDLFVGDTFFLDVLLVLDSFSLQVSLLPLLIHRVQTHLASAVNATDIDIFAHHVLLSRRFARMLTVCLCKYHWSFSEFATQTTTNNTDTTTTTTNNNYNTNNANHRAMKPITSLFAASMRAQFCQSTLEALALRQMLRTAVSQNELLPIIALASICEPLLKLLSLDPIASRTQWYFDLLHAIRNLHVLPLDSEVDTAARTIDEDATLPKMLLLNVIVGSVLEFPGVNGEMVQSPTTEFRARVSKQYWGVFDRPALLKLIAPALGKLHRHLAGVKGHVGKRRRKTTMKAPIKATSKPGNDTTVVKRRIMPRAVAPTPVQAQNAGVTVASGTSKGDDSGNSRLKEAFFSQMDAQLRDLMRLVVKTIPSTDEQTRRTFVKAARLLFPNEYKNRETIIAVAANLCVEQVRDVRGVERRKEEVMEGIVGMKVDSGIEKSTE